MPRKRNKIEASEKSGALLFTEELTKRKSNKDKIGNR